MEDVFANLGHKLHEVSDAARQMAALGSELLNLLPLAAPVTPQHNCGTHLRSKV